MRVRRTAGCTRPATNTCAAKILRAVTITALVVALGSLAYFCLELLGFPRQSMIWVSILGWSAFNLQLLFVILAPRAAKPEPVSFRGASS